VGGQILGGINGMGKVPRGFRVRKGRLIGIGRKDLRNDTLQIATRGGLGMGGRNLIEEP